MIEMDASDVRQAMQSLRRAMAAGADGKQLKRDLSKRLRKIAEPLAQEQRQRVLRLPSKGHAGPSMRQAVARQIKAATRWSGDNTGVSVVQKTRGMPRNFDYAGRMFNRPEGWNPQSLGGETMHQQVRPTGWFDEPTKGKRPAITREIQEALEDTAAKIASRSR